MPNTVIFVEGVDLNQLALNNICRWASVIKMMKFWVPYKRGIY
jgi:hypothetical protein